MEQLKITHMEMDVREDFSELHMLINSDAPRPAVSYLMDEDHDFYLRVELETEKIVGASVLFAKDWFEEIAAAFQNNDLNHPDVRFFLEQKMRELAARLETELEEERKEPSQSEDVEPSLDIAR